MTTVNAALMSYKVGSSLEWQHLAVGMQVRVAVLAVGWSRSTSSMPGQCAVRMSFKIHTAVITTQHAASLET